MRTNSRKLATFSWERDELAASKHWVFDQDRPVITMELNGGLIYSITNIFSTDIHVI